MISSKFTFIEDVYCKADCMERKTTRQRGCQIDYLIQTRLNILFIFEIKFSMNELKSSIIPEVKEKINRLALPRGYSCIPVLIHVNGVSDTVRDQGYFYKIIDFRELFYTGDES